MARSDRRGSRSGRKSRKKRSAETGSPGRHTGKAAAEPTHSYSHPVFGPIPLLVYTWTDADGQQRSSYAFDPDYQPPLPPGAVRGSPRRQLGRGAFDTPRYFYVDQERRCVQCREAFVFTAGEQKRWYETLGFNFASVAIRCGRCRRQRRSDKALHHAVDDAKRALLDAPDDAGKQLALAEAIVELRTRKGHGKLDQAVSAARKARQLLAAQPANHRALTHYWEARAQALAEREDKARAAFEAFVMHAGGKALRQQLRLAEDWLARHPTP